MSAAAVLTLAVLVGCLPRPAATARLVALWPVPGPRRGWRPRAAAPALVGAMAGLLALGPAGAPAGALIVATVRRRQARRRAGAAATAASDQLADSVRRMTDELRAGGHPAATLAGVSADGPLARVYLGPAAAAAELGEGVAGALRRTTIDLPGIAADVERIAMAWSLAERHGIPLADLLARAHADIRWRIRFGAGVQAQLAGPRATATVLTCLPLLGIGLGQLIGADPVGVLRGGVPGQILLLVGVGLAAAGVAWSEHILRSAVPR